MSIPINSNFELGAPLPIDKRMTLTYEQMAGMNDNIMPSVYFTICIDDGCLYLYNKNNIKTAKTGRFIKISQGYSPEYVNQLVFATYLEFPNIGDVETLYIATDEDTMYIYNDNTQSYIAITSPDFDTIQSTL